MHSAVNAMSYNQQRPENYGFQEPTSCRQLIWSASNTKPSPKGKLGQLAKTQCALAEKQSRAAEEALLLAYDLNMKGWKARETAHMTTDSLSKSNLFFTSANLVSAGFESNYTANEWRSMASRTEQRSIILQHADIGLRLFFSDPDFTGHFNYNVADLKWLQSYGTYKHKRLVWIDNQSPIRRAIILALFKLQDWIDFENLTYNLIIEGIIEESLENDWLVIKVNDLWAARGCTSSTSRQNDLCSSLIL